MAAEVTRRGAFDMQVCVPSDWTDDQAIEFAEKSNRCGTENGWFVRKDGNPRLNSAPERVPCAQRAGHVHIMLEA